jgi:hypothetical protein
VTANEVDEGNWVVALVAEHQLERVDEDESELSDLNERKKVINATNLRSLSPHLEKRVKTFPPEENFLGCREDSGEHKVSVNYDVNRRVDKPEEC